MDGAFSVRCKNFGFKSWSRWQWSNSSFPTCLKQNIVLVRFLGIKKLSFYRGNKTGLHSFVAKVLNPSALDFSRFHSHGELGIRGFSYMKISLEDELN